MNLEIKKPDKKSIYFLAAVLAIALLVFSGILWYIYRPLEIVVPEEKPTGKTMEQTIESLTAPPGKIEPVSEDILKRLTAPE